MKSQHALHFKNLGLFCISLLCVFSFSSVYATKNIKFSVDLSLLISQSQFNPSTDIVYIRGTFNNWETTTPLTAGGNNVYSVTIPLADWSYHEYKYFINTPGATNGGYENNFPVASSGNRKLCMGEYDLTLPTVYYNDGEMNKVKSTAHFTIYYTAYDNSYVDEFASRIEKCYNIISNAIQSFPIAKTNIYLYKDLDQLHMACGYPENGPSSVGSAWGASLITMLAPSKSGLDDALGLFTHEFTHCLIASKTKVTISTWLNEGTACYYGRQFSTKDWIKSMMNQQGKPNIADIWNGNMGYAYSGILVYYIIKTKGELAMAKFIENMNFADIGYANIEALQTDWHAFLDVYLDYETTVNVKFSVDMADMISAKYFKPATDKVYVNMRGTLSDWSLTQMNLESGTIYSVTLPVNRYNFFEYKFYTNSPTTPNGGYELKVDETTLGNRLLNVENTNKILATVKFNSNAVNGLDMIPINNKINVLKLHKTRYGITPDFSNFKYSFKILTESEYQAQKPLNTLPFDVGFITVDGTINVSAPVTTAQKAVFADINKAALYYLCQSYIQFYYNTTAMPIWFKVGFAAFEAHLDPSESTIKMALNAYGGSISSFSVLNDLTNFNANNGFAIAYAFGEYMNIYKEWGYPTTYIVDANNINVDPWWWNVYTTDRLLKVWNNYMKARFLEPTESLRVKLYLETDHFKFYTREADSKNFPAFNDVLEPAYSEYVANFGVTASEKLTFFTLPECGLGADIEELPCGNRITGGTAWSSGLHSTCAATVDQIPLFVIQNRHELAHVFQGLLPQGTVTAWLNEGFAHFCAFGPITTDRMIEWRQYGIDAIKAGTTYFGHLPTYEDTKVYPSPDYGYYTMGYFLNDYIYKRGGYNLLKAVQQNDLVAYQSLGYATAQTFLNDFYFDFDVRVQNKNIVTLITPTTNTESTTSTININWIPLKADVKLNVAVSTNNGADWTNIATKTTSTSCTWNAANYTGKFLLKFSAPDNLNIETIYGPFNKVDLAKPMINFPTGNEYLIAGDTVDILWANTTLSVFKIEFSGDNGTSWSTVNSAVAASAKTYKWIVPWTISDQCKIRISDAANAINNDLSDNNFTILRPNQIGGPYLMDKNTVLLMHFDNDLNNRSNLSANGIGSTQNIVSDSTLSPLLGKCIKTTSPVTIPHNENLSLTGDWTIEAWVKPKSLTPNVNMYILTKPGNTDSYASNYSLEINPWWGNVFHGFYFSDASSRSGVSNYTPTLNQWYHIAFMRDTKTLQLKMMIHDKERTLIASQSNSYTGTTTFVNTKDILIGSGMDGYIDEVRISNIVRDFSSTAINSTAENKLLSVFPNPSKGLVKMHLQPDAFNTELYISNMAGQIVYRKKITTILDLTIDLTSVSKGLYFIHTEGAGKQTQIEKLIIQ